MDHALIEAMVQPPALLPGGDGGRGPPNGWKNRNPHDGHDEDDSFGEEGYEELCSRDLRFSLVIHSARIIKNHPSPKQEKPQITHLLWRRCVHVHGWIYTGTRKGSAGCATREVSSRTACARIGGVRGRHVFSAAVYLGGLL